MTKQDYELIAHVIREAPFTDDERPNRMIFIMQLAAALQGDNPRFDQVRFLKACGIED